jgi:hypothetical protein
MKILKAGSSGATVRQWQTFLRGQGLTVNVNGSFDAATEEATRAFQVRNKLGVDGAVGNETFGRAALLGFELVPIAHRHGFYWGGHFSQRDGMHFEVAQV